MSEEQKIRFLQELIKSDGWAIVEERLDVMIQEVESKLFGDDDEGIADAVPLKEGEIELLRRQRKHLMSLKNIPNQVIFEANLNKGNMIDSYDPYEDEEDE